MAKWGSKKPWDKPPFKELPPTEVEPDKTEDEEDVAGHHGPSEPIDIDEEAREMGLYDEADSEHPVELGIGQETEKDEKNHLKEG